MSQMAVLLLLMVTGEAAIFPMPAIECAHAVQAVEADEIVTVFTFDGRSVRVVAAVCHPIPDEDEDDEAEAMS